MSDRSSAMKRTAEESGQLQTRKEINDEYERLHKWSAKEIVDRLAITIVNAYGLQLFYSRLPDGLDYPHRDEKLCTGTHYYLDRKDAEGDADDPRLEIRSIIVLSVLTLLDLRKQSYPVTAFAEVGYSQEAEHYLQSKTAGGLWFEEWMSRTFLNINGMIRYEHGRTYFSLFMRHNALPKERQIEHIHVHNPAKLSFRTGSSKIAGYKPAALCSAALDDSDGE